MFSVEKSVDYITIPAIVLNSEKLIIHTNDIFCKLLNIKNEDIINNKINGTLFNTIIDNPEILDEINNSLDNYEEKHIILNINDYKRWFKVNVLKFKNGTVNYMLSFENISNSYNIFYLYEQIFNNTNTGIIILKQNNNKDFIIKDMNPIAVELFNYNPDNKTINKFIEYIFNDNKISNILLDINDDGIKREIKKIKYLEYFFNLTLIKVKSDEIIIMIDDITKQTKILEKLEKSDRYKTEFLSNMSHEIRSPINSIVGFSDMLKDVKDDSKKINNYIDIIKNSSESLMKIVNDILDFSKIEEGKLEINKLNFDINKIMENLFIINKNKLKNNNINLVLNIPKISSKILNDSFRFEQIINNLVNNSMKFTKKGVIEIGYKKRDSDYLFYVKDTGIGIKEEEQNRIFNRYTQAKSSNLNQKIKGHGLGLSISKELVKLMGGDIWVDSEFGKGSTFYFTLPNNNKNIKDNTLIIESEVFKTDFSEKTILIVEDIEFNIKLIESYLEQTGAILIIATDGNDALLKYNENKSSIDLILMDIQLPEMNGSDVTKIIRIIDKDTPIIAQTAYAMKDENDKLMSYGFNDIINKPIKKNDLLKMIYKYIK